MDVGDEMVSDPQEARRLRAQARRVYLETVSGAALLTGLGLLAGLWFGGG
ncbi:MAG TPA: hypothetical protein VID04_03360 [Methylomirabilota bacterium]